MTCDEQKIKVVWVCNFSNSLVVERLSFRLGLLNTLLRHLLGRTKAIDTSDFGVWITNGIAEFEQFDDIELHVVAPYHFLRPTVQEFEEKGIFYHFFSDERYTLLGSIRTKYINPIHLSYKRNRYYISKAIKKIQPDIIHIIGAENPYYAMAIHDIPKTIPTIVQLQTLMNDPGFLNNYPIDKKTLKHRSAEELRVINRADFIGTRDVKYIDVIKSSIKPDAKFLDIMLATGETAHYADDKKEFDFVYFASNISKAGDLALEAFGLAHKQNPSITLDVVGGSEYDTQESFRGIIAKYGIAENVSFEGRLKTHHDVITQIRKSRIALLPLRVDLTSGTIREAMANGLPVLTTDTGDQGTRRLNNNRRSVLISPIGNHQALSDNMLLLLENKSLANELKSNAFESLKESYNNSKAMKEWADAYKACLNVQVK